MKHFSRSLVWLTTSEIAFNLAAYVVHSVVGRILGPADYGRYGLVVTFTTMIIVLIGNGIPTAMSKYLSEVLETNPERIAAIKRKTAILQTLIIGSVTAIFFLVSPLIATLLHDPSLTRLFQLSSLVIPAFAAASFYHYYLIGLHLFRLQAIVKIIRSFARVGCIALAAIYFGLDGAVAGYILAPLLTFIAVIIIDELYIKRRLRLGERVIGAEYHFPARTLLNYAGPLTLFLIFYELILTLDLYFVKALLQDDHLTGLYNAAITVGRIPYYLFAALAMILLPAISKTTAERNDAQTTSLIERSLRLLALILFPLVALLSAYANEILHLFYGNRYDGAAAAMQVFAVGVGFLTVFYVLAFALNGAGLVKIPLRLSVAGFLGMLILNFALIPPFGIVGAALATTITSGILMIGILIYTEIHFRAKLSVRLILVSLASAIGIALLATHVLPRGPWSFLFSGFILTALYYGTLRITHELTDDDLAPLLKFLNRKPTA